MSTKAEVTRLAEQRADLDMAIEFQGSQNAPRDINKRIQAQAELAILRDKRDAVNMEYQKAFGDWHRRGFPETETGL